MVRTAAGALCAAVLLSGCGGAAHTQRETLAGLLGINTVGTYRTPSGSMEPTLRLGEHFDAHRARLAVGEVVVLHPPRGAAAEACGPRPHVVKPGGRACDAAVPHEDRETLFVRRIVAGPGDRLFIHGGHVYRQQGGHGGFAREPDAYARACPADPSTACEFPVTIRVPAGDWYTLGDNRGESIDSRSYGPIPSGGMSAS
jgi:signal peptidase I